MGGGGGGGVMGDGVLEVNIQHNCVCVNILVF